MRWDDIWNQLTPSDWLNILLEYRPSNEWVENNGALKGRCFYHAENSASAYLNTEKRFFKCFGCDEWSSNPVEIVSAICNITYSEAFALLRQEYGVQFEESKYGKNAMEAERVQNIRAALAKAFNTELVAASNDPKHACYEAAEYLKSRGITSDYNLLPLGVIPTTKRLRELLPTAIADQCVNYMSGWLTTDFLGSLVFIYHSSSKNVARFRIRVPFTKRIYAVEDPEGDKGFFGLALPIYQPLMFGKNKLSVTLVEGEFDQLALAYGQLKEGVADRVYLSVGGSESKCMDGLGDLGFKDATIVADHPKYNGDVIISGILKSTAEFPLKVFVWPKDFEAKDPDEAVKSFGFRESLSVFSDGDYHKPPHIWAFLKTSAECAMINVDDVKSRDAIISNWGNVLADETEKLAYLEKVSKDLNISYKVLAKAVLSGDDDELSYVNRIVNAIRNEYDIIGEENNGTVSCLHVWNKRKQLLRKLPLARLQEVEVELSKDIGMISTWMAENVGEPAFIKYRFSAGEKQIPTTLLDREQKVRQYLALALREIISDARNYRHLETKGQGIHYLQTQDGPRVLIVNGKEVYAGRYAENGDLAWQVLNSPVFYDYMLDLDPGARWSYTINSVEDLALANTVDTKKIFETVHDILNRGWSFQNQWEETMFLAAQAMIMPIASNLKRMTYIFITAEASSGKTTLNLGFFAGTQYPNIQVVETAVGMDDYTEAGFRQDMNNKALLCCLDEFEDDGSGSQKSVEIRKILKTLRNIMGASNRIVRGSPGGEIKSYYLRFPVIMSAISTMREPADVSRMVTINMKTDRTRTNPVIAISEQYSELDMEAIRKNVTLALIRVLPRLLEEYEAIEQEYARGGDLPKDVQTRFREGIYPCLAMLKTIGADYKEFARRFCVVKSGHIARITSATESEDILSAIMNSPNVRANLEDRISAQTTVGELLAAPETRALLNTTGCGVTYFEYGDEEYIVVNWTQAIQGVLAGHPKYRHEYSVGHIKEMAERSPYAIHQDKLRRYGIIRKVLGSTVRLQDVTAYSLTKIHESIKEDNV